MSKGDWLRVSRQRRCPVCGKPDWCLIWADGSAAICTRIEVGSVKRCGEAGWLHRLSKNRSRPDRVRTVHVEAHPRKSQDISELAEQYAKAVNEEALAGLAEDLGLTVGSLRRLHVGWDGQAWTFPMSDAAGRIVGIRRRFPDGRKWSLKGGREGVFVPTDLPGTGQLLICEGPTDTAAVLGLGFPAIGRPSCRTGVRILREMARGRDVVIMADADEPGQQGAVALGQVLRLHCPSTKVVTPPTGVKDVRAWRQVGATHERVAAAIEAAPILRVRVLSSRTLPCTKVSD